jgi:hypothetical protein
MMRAVCFVLLVLAALPAQAYKRSVTEKGGDVCLYWPQRSVTWHAASPLGAAAGEDAALRALRASARSWSDAGCSDFTLVEGGRAGRAIGYDRKGVNENVLLFRGEASCTRYQSDPCFEAGTCADQHDCWDYDDGLLAVTTTTFDRCGQLLDADIEFNGGLYDFTAVDGPPCSTGSHTGCVDFDIQNTATHEMGHLLGLDHPTSGVDVTEATMYASAGSGETKKRTLAQDDLDGLCAIYPTGKPAAFCTNPQECAAPAKSSSRCAAGDGPASLLALAAVMLALPRRRAR